MIPEGIDRGGVTPSRKIHRWFLLAGLCLVMAFTFCTGGGGGKSGSTVGVSGSRLEWVAPTRFSDGSVLNPANDLASYEIYVNESGSFGASDSPRALVSAVDGATGTAVTSYDLSKIVPPLQKGTTYYLTMKVIDRNGYSSEYSLPPLRFTY